MVTSKAILDNLKKEDISSLLQDIQLLFKLTEGKVPCDEVIHIIKALRHLLLAHKESNKPDSYNLKLKLIPSISLCVDYIKTHFIQEHVSTQVCLPILYSIIKVYLETELYCPAISYAESCITLFSNEQNLNNIYFKNLYILFWNEAFRIEKASEDFVTAFKLRCEAVNFLILEDCYSTLEEKVLLVLSRYCHCNERDHDKIINFINCVWNNIFNKKKESDYSLFLLKLLHSWFIFLLKNFKNSLILKQILSCVSELASHLDEHFNHSIFFKTCLEISSLSIQVFVLKEDKTVSKKSLLCYKKVISNYSADFEIDMLTYMYSFFYYSFIQTCKNLEVFQEERNTHSIKRNLDFILLLSTYYLKMPSDIKSEKHSIFSSDFHLTFSNTLAYVFEYLIRNEKDPKKIKVHINQIQNFLKSSEHILKPVAPTYEVKKKVSGFAIIFGNIAAHLFNCTLYHESIWFLENCCDFLSVYGTKDGDSFKQLIKKKEVLVASYFRSGSHEKALQTTVQLLLENVDKKKEYMKLWHKVKKDALKKNNTSVISRTFSDVMSELNASISPDHEVDILCEELKYSRSDRCFFMCEIVAAVNKILSLPCQGLKRAHALLEVVNIAPSINMVSGISNKSLLEICQESITLYKEHISKNPIDMAAKLQLSVNYYWLYYLKQKKLHQVAEKEAEMCLEIPLGDEKNAENELCDIKPIFPLVTYLVEADALSSLELALEIWSEISNSVDCSWSDLMDVLMDWDFFMIMKSAAEVFATSTQNISELKTLIIIRSVAASLGNKIHQISTSISLTNFLVKLGYLEAAEELLQKIECDSSDLFLNHSSDDDFDVVLLKLNLQLAKSQFCLLTGKFDEGLTILRNMLENHVMEKSSKSVKLIEAETLILLSKFLLIPPSVYSVAKNVEYFQAHTAISSSLRGVTLARGILKKVSEKDGLSSYDDWIPFKAMLLRCILKGFLQLSEQYVNVGDPRYGRCFLREGLKLAESHVLTYWTSKILLLLGRIDLLCDNSNDCLVKLQGLKYIMNESSKQNISLQLHKVYDENETSDLSDLIEEFSIPAPSKIKFKRNMEQNFIGNFDVQTSPVSYEKEAFEFEFKLNKDTDKRNYTVCFTKLEIWELGCLHLVSLDKESLAEKQFKKILSICDKLRKSDKITNVLLSAELGLKTNKFCRVLPSPEILLEISVLLRLSHLCFLRNEIENANSYLKSASEKMDWSYHGKYLYPQMYALLKYHTLIIAMKNLIEIKPKSCLEFFICPSSKYSATFLSRRSSKLEVSSELNFNTPVKNKFPEIVITPCPTVERVAKAPVKKDVLPSYMAKDMQIFEALNFSSDEDVSDACEKSDDSRILRPKMVSNLKSQNLKKNSKCATYKLFKSKNTNLSIKSASDVWKCATLSTPKVHKNSCKNEPPVKTKRNTRSASTLKSRQPLPKSVSLSPKKCSKSKSTTHQFYVDEIENLEESNVEVNDYTLGRKGSIECTRSSSENRLNIISKTTSEEEWMDSEVFLPNEDIVSSHDVDPEPGIFGVFDELCENINQMNIASEKTDGNNMQSIPVENLKEFIAELDNLRLFIQHSAPYPIYTNICRLLGVLMLYEASIMKDESKLLSCAFLLSETFASTLRHIHLNKLLYSKDLTSGAMKSLAPYSLKTKFPMNSQMEYLLNAIPKDITVVQISALSNTECHSSSKKYTASKLLICRYQPNSKPLTMCIDSSSNQRFHSCVFSEFDTLMKESCVTMKKDHDDTRKWWKTRSTLDSRLQALMKDMEEIWLGCWKCLLLSTPISKQRTQKLSKLADTLSKLGKSIDRNLLQVFLDSVPLLKREQISAVICQLWNCNPLDTVYTKVFKIVWDSALVLPDTERHPLILILDKHLQSFPWESLPILQDIPVSRMPSLSLMSSKLEGDSVFQKGCDSDKTFYILNPDGDLKYSQEYFQPRFEKFLRWKGITHQIPTIEECILAIQDYDLFIYCGHGSGRQYFGKTAIDKLKCNAAAILVGCSSGYLRPLGKDLEAYGFPLTYLMNGCPCVVGNLWDVTDKDIDRFADKFFEQFLPGYSENKTAKISSIAKAVSEGRKACRMRYLVGAAPVVYGLPISAKKPS